MFLLKIVFFVFFEFCSKVDNNNHHYYQHSFIHSFILIVFLMHSARNLLGFFFGIDVVVVIALVVFVHSHIICCYTFFVEWNGIEFE